MRTPENRCDVGDGSIHRLLVRYDLPSVKVTGPTPRRPGGAVLGERRSARDVGARMIEIPAIDPKVRLRTDSHPIDELVAVKDLKLGTGGRR